MSKKSSWTWRWGLRILIWFLELLLRILKKFLPKSK